MPILGRKEFTYMSVEQIKFGTHLFNLVPDGVRLSDNGGKILFEKGTNTFEEIKTILKANGDIEQINTSGQPDWSRSDLIYGGRLMEIDGYEVSEGVTKEVMQAEFRLPDVNEVLVKLAETDARVDYIAMIANVNVMEVL